MTVYQFHLEALRGMRCFLCLPEVFHVFHDEDVPGSYCPFSLVQARETLEVDLTLIGVDWQ